MKYKLADLLRHRELVAGTSFTSFFSYCYLCSMLPTRLLDSLEGVNGFDRASFEQAHEPGKQLTSIRLNPFKIFTGHADWQMEAVPWCPLGRYLAERPSFTLDPVFHAGAYYVQEASSMFLWHLLSQIVADEPSYKILDLCAAPGGKSTLLASYFTKGLVVSNEVIKPRANILVENVIKWGSGNLVVTNNDPSHFQSLPGYFDVMVVDAPCSGSGLFRKDPEAIEEWSEDNVALCSQRQQRILADALPALKEDGLLVYATCSYSPAEDEDIANWLVSEMQMESIPVTVPAEWGITISADGTGYRFYPGKTKGEGFFIAAFKKRSAVDSIRLKEQVLSRASKQETAQVLEFIPLPGNYSLFKQGDAIRTIDTDWLQPLQQLAANLYIKKAGTEIGAIKGKDVIPSHELALGVLPLDQFSFIDVSKEEALQYLRRKDLSLESSTGWRLIRYNNLPLGWVKVLPNRINNYYPAEWRILKE